MIATKKFEIPVYGSTLRVIIFDENNWDKVVNYLSKLKFKSANDIKKWSYIYGLQIAETIKNKRCFVTILKKIPNIESAFVHELYHLTQDILDWKDVEYKKRGANEPYAYLQETLYRKLIPFIREHKPVKIAAKKKRKTKKKK